VYVFLFVIAGESTTPLSVHETPLSAPSTSLQEVSAEQQDEHYDKGPNSTPRSLFQIRPLPKAGPRIGKNKPRKRGRTRILTDTPEKQMIEQETAERQLAKKPKKSSTKAKGKSMPATKAPTKVKNSKKPRQEQVDSDTDEVFCLICTEPYSNSRPREKWVRCVECCLWAHEECTAGSSPFICQNCDSDDDVN